jgi:catechol 2,3-dioxygenase-like lactoylglutathione lyase family enzyme
MSSEEQRTLGVEHIGVGVSDPERSLAFYADLGFTEVAFDYEGPLPGLERVAGREDVRARVVMLRAAHETVLGSAAVKLVHTTDAPPPPMPEGMAWGEPGVCEVCVHVCEQAELYRRLVDERGHAGLMEPNESPLPPYGTRCSLSYVADPDGTKIELIEWLDLEAGWPEGPGPQGVNHVAFGVASLERTREFYRGLGFTGMLFESDGYFEPMHPWYAPREPPRQRMTLLTNPHGAGMEPVEHHPPSPDMRGAWGHLGPFDFGIGVRNLDLAARALEARGVTLLCAPQTVELGGGAAWRYAYFLDPDELAVCLSEARY